MWAGAVNALLLVVSTVKPQVAIFSTFGADGVLLRFWALIGEVLFHRITLHAGHNRGVVLLFYLVVRDPHVKHFESLFLAFLCWGYLCKTDFDDVVAWEFVDALDEVFSVGIHPVDFLPKFILRLAFDVAVNTKEQDGAFSFLVRGRMGVKASFFRLSRHSVSNILSVSFSELEMTTKPSRVCSILVTYISCCARSWSSLRFPFSLGEGCFIFNRAMVENLGGDGLLPSLSCWWA